MTRLIERFSVYTVPVVRLAGRPLTVTCRLPEPLLDAITQRSPGVAPSRLITSTLESLAFRVCVEPGLTSAGASGLWALISWINPLRTSFQNVQLQP